MADEFLDDLEFEEEEDQENEVFFDDLDFGDDEVASGSESFDDLDFGDDEDREIDSRFNELRKTRESLEVDPVNNKGEDFDTWFNNRINTDDYESEVEDIESGSWGTPLKGALASVAKIGSSLGNLLDWNFGGKRLTQLEFSRKVMSGEINYDTLTDEQKKHMRDPEEMFALNRWFAEKQIQLEQGLSSMTASAGRNIADAIENNETIKAWTEANQKQSAGEINPFEDDASLNEVAKTWASVIAEQSRFFASHAGGPMTASSVAYAGMHEEFRESAEANGFSNEQVSKYIEEVSRINGSLEYAGELLTLGLGKKLGGRLPFIKKLKSKAASMVGGAVLGKVIGAGGEGLTEYSQQAVMNHYMGKMARESGMSDEEIVAKFKNSPLWESRDFWVGAGVSLIMGTAGDLTNRVAKNKASKAQKIIEDKVTEARANLQPIIETEDVLTPQELREQDVVAEAQRRTEARSIEEQSYQEEIDNISGYDKRVLAGQVEELYGDTVNPNTLTDAEGNVSDEVKFELEERAQERAEVESAQQTEREAFIDKMEAQLERETVVKDIQSQIKEVHKQAVETKDKAKRRELLSQELDLTNQLKGTEESNKAIEEEELVLQDIELMEAEAEIEDLESEEATLFENGNVGRERLEGRDYMTKQVEVIKSIQDLTGMSEAESSAYYVEHFAKAFEENHKIHPQEVAGKVEAQAATEGGSTFNSKGESLSGTQNIAVAEHPELTKIVDGKLTEENAEQEIESYRKEHKDLLASDEQLAVGTWYNEDDGKTYIDITTVIPKAQMDEAIQRGRDANQIAVFDLETFEEIDTGGTGEEVAQTVELDTGEQLSLEDLEELSFDIKEMKTEGEQEVIEKQRVKEEKKETKKARLKSKPRDIQTGERPLVKAPKLAEAIQELKTEQEQAQTKRREKVEKARETGPKERAAGFKEIAEGKVIKKITTDVNEVMGWLESQAKKVASGVRSEIVTMQKELAKRTRDVLPVSVRGKLISRINGLAKIKNPELRTQKFNEAVEYVNEQLDVENKRIALVSVKKTIRDLQSKQRKVTTKKGREGFGTKETAKLAGKVVDLRAEATLSGKKLSQTKDKKEQAKLKAKITKLNQEAARLEAFNTLSKSTEGPNEAIRAQLNNIVAISKQRINKMEKAQEQYANGELKAIPNDIQKDIVILASGKININSLSTEELNQLNEKLLALAEGKKAVASYINNETKQQAQARLTLSLEEITKNNDSEIQSGPKKDVKGGALAGLKAYVRRPRLAIQALAGGTDTHTYANTVGKVDQAFNNSLAISEMFNEKKGEIFGKINEKLIGKKLDFYDALTKPDTEINGKMHTKNEIMELYALSQSPDGQRVLENTGYETDAKVYSDMLGADYTQAVDKYLEFLSSEMYDTLNVEYKRQHGVDMPRVEGKYFPLISLESAFKGDALSLEDFGDTYAMPHLNDGMTHERVPHNYKLGSLDFFGKTSLYEKRSARFAGEAELLSQAQQLIKSTEFQNTVNGVNKHYMKAIDQWITQVVSGSQFEKSTRDTLWDGVFALKSQFVRSVLPTRLSVIAKQVPSFIGATPELSGKGFADSLHAIMNPVAINDFVNSKSVMMRNRLESSMQRLSENLKTAKSGEAMIENEVIRKAKKGLHIAGNISDATFVKGIGATDKLVTNSLWYGQYMDSIREGKSEEQAANDADELITRTQPTFNNKDLSQMNRNRLVSIFKMFTSQIDQNLNRVIDVIEGKKMGLSAKERGSRVQGLVQSTALISTLTLLMRWAKDYYDDDTDPEFKVTPYEYLAENMGKRFAMDASHGIMGGVPVLNTASDILTLETYNKMFDKKSTFYEYRNQLQGVLKSPVGQVVDDVLQAYNYKLNGNDEKANSTIMRAVEKLSGVPYSGAKTSFKQVGGLIKYLSDQLKDGDPRKQKLEEIDF